MRLRNKKTGEIAEIKLKLNESLPDGIRRTIEEAGWEETREPLIKDEKIRKAVRAWAEAIGINGAKYDESWSAFRFNNCAICFKGKYYFGELEDGEDYSITELCGEEEE